jgi:tRNA-dihydrouridine synthase
VKIPVIGNGDIATPEDAVRMVAETGCDGVMVGRAASFNPWIFRQISQYVTGGAYEQPSESDRYRTIRHYYGLLAESGDPETVGKMKQFATYFTHGVRGGAQLRASIYQSREPRVIADLVDRFFEPVLASSAHDEEGAGLVLA